MMKGMVESLEWLIEERRESLTMYSTYSTRAHGVATDGYFEDIP